MGKILKICGTVGGALVVGAVGSGIWERILSPAISFVSEGIANTLSRYSQSYSDSIYKGAANIHGGATVIDLSVLLVQMASLALFSYGFHMVMASKYGHGSDQHRSYSVFNGYMQVAFAAVLFFLGVFLNAKSTAVKDARGYSLTGMDIVRPYIGDEDYYKLMSQFLRVKTESEFKEFVSALRERSNNSGVNIGDFKEF